MSYLIRFKKLKDQGMAGLARGIPFTSEKMNEYIFGIQKAMIYMIAAGSGVGKSAVLNEQFVFNVFDQYYEGKIKHPLKIHYFSLEIAEDQIITKLAVR